MTDYSDIENWTDAKARAEIERLQDVLTRLKNRLSEDQFKVDCWRDNYTEVRCDTRCDPNGTIIETRRFRP